MEKSFQQLLQFCDHYHRLDDRSREALLPLCRLQNFRKGDDLQPIGRTCRTIYFMAKGLARIYYNKNGFDITESFAAENQIIVRVESLFTGRPSRKGIQILEDSDIIAVDATMLFKLYDDYPQLERLFRKIFEASHVDLVNRIESLQFHSAEERYRDLLEKWPNILLRAPLRHIASWLGITQRSLSRIRAQY